MVANTFNSRFCKTRQGVLCEIEASLVCIVISRPARAMQRPCLQIPNQINPQNQTKQNKVHLPLCPPHLDVNFIAVLFHISLYKTKFALLKNWELLLSLVAYQTLKTRPHNIYFRHRLGELSWNWFGNLLPEDELAYYQKVLYKLPRKKATNSLIHL